MMIINSNSIALKCKTTLALGIQPLYNLNNKRSKIKIKERIKNKYEINKKNKKREKLIKFDGQ